MVEKIHKNLFAKKVDLPDFAWSFSMIFSLAHAAKTIADTAQKRAN
jgi:hypothetical protein